MQNAYKKPAATKLFSRPTSSIAYHKDKDLLVLIPTRHSVKSLHPNTYRLGRRKISVIRGDVFTHGSTISCPFIAR